MAKVYSIFKLLENFAMPKIKTPKITLKQRKLDCKKNGHNFNKTNTEVLHIIDDGEGSPIVVLKCGFCKQSWRCYPFTISNFKKLNKID